MQRRTSPQREHGPFLPALALGAGKWDVLPLRFTPLSTAPPGSVRSPRAYGSKAIADLDAQPFVADALLEQVECTAGGDVELVADHQPDAGADAEDAADVLGAQGKSGRRVGVAAAGELVTVQLCGADQLDVVAAAPQLPVEAA